MEYPIKMKIYQAIDLEIKYKGIKFHVKLRNKQADMAILSPAQKVQQRRKGGKLGGGGGKRRVQ